MYKILLPFITLLTSIYTLEFTDVNGNQISMSTCEGKKILIVNIASASPRVSQIGELQELQQLYGDSVKIIAFPSNSFGSEPKTNSEIKTLCQQTYGATFAIASKVSVTGESIHPVYSWLASKTQNGSLDAVVKKDFQKFLINKEGKLVGVYSPSLSPMDSAIQYAITHN